MIDRGIEEQPRFHKLSAPKFRSPIRHLLVLIENGMGSGVSGARRVVTDPFLTGVPSFSVYPPQPRSAFKHRVQNGRASSHLTRRAL